MTIDTFYAGTDWESSSGPILSRQVTNGIYPATDIWPVGVGSERNGGNKDDLADGLHPVVAIGPKALRPINPVGSVMTYEATTGLTQMNLAPGHIVKAYVANVTAYDVGATHNPNAWDTSLAIGEPVYVDDSDGLDAGVTLSRAPINGWSDNNPLAGYLWYDQNDYVDYHLGGAHATADWPKVVAGSTVYTLVSVLIWPDNH
jgi:hypothetical protein